MSDVVKPVVTPLEKFVDQSVKQEYVVKNAMEDDVDEQADQFDGTFRTAYGDSAEAEELDTTIRDDTGLKDDLA